MDTKEMELKQGATADLLQQKPHVEVADSKTSAVSSDEERLAAGISMIGLHTKRLSGAQRKKTYYRKKDGGDLGGIETSKKNSSISSQGNNRGAVGGGEKTPTQTRAHHP
jgi:hypothetical protein